MKNISKMIVDACKKYDIPYTSIYDVSNDDIEEMEKINEQLELLYLELSEIETRHEEIIKFKGLTEQILGELKILLKDLKEDIKLLRS